MVILAIVGWMVYVLAYTPLKRRSIWQTPVGAAAGAMPALLGAAAVGSPLNPIGWSLFGIVFCWQLPHAMAIAWLYRRQFADAGVRVATVVDPTGRIAARFAVFGAILLMPVSFAPVMFSEMGWIYGVLAALLGLGYFLFSFAFYRSRDDATAWRLLWASLAYLPLMLIGDGGEEFLRSGTIVQRIKPWLMRAEIIVNKKTIVTHNSQRLTTAGGNPLIFRRSLPAGY